MPNALGTQVFLLQDYTGPNPGYSAGNINANSLKDKDTGAPISLMVAPSPYGINPAIWYFMLGPKQTAQLTDYVNTPVWLALWVPVDSSATGQNPSTAWFNNTCFGPKTYQAPSTATPAGATFVEFNVGPSKNPVTGKINTPPFDTVDISEVNGVNAAWSVDLPGGWTNSAFKDRDKKLIPVPQIKNNPGATPNFYGDYGNPGVYPFGCTNCASRYNNPSAPGTPPGIQRSGCLAAQNQSPVTYPTLDVGCNNAINYYPNNANSSPPPSTPNPPLPAYQAPPPGVQSLPKDDAYVSGPDHTLDDLSKQVPIPFVGYGICEVARGSLPNGGSIDVTLQHYPFGQMQ